MATQEELEKALELAQEFLASKNIPALVGSWDEYGSLPVLSVGSEDPSDLQKALKAAENCNPRLAILTSGRMARDEWETAISNAEALEADVERDESLEMLRRLEGEIDSLAAVTVEILCGSPPLLITFSAYSDWNQSFYDLVPEEDESNADEDDEPDELGDFAKELAENEIFQRARNKHERTVAMRRILANHDIKPWQEQEVINQACAIYRMEILPDKEEELRSKAVSLSESGLSAGAIAAKLGIKRSDVQRLLP